MTHFYCFDCNREQIDDSECRNCFQDMDSGSKCIHCLCAKATHDDVCLHCLAGEVLDRVVTVESLPVEWQREVSDEVAREVAYRETKRIAAQAKAREEYLAMLVMVARAPVNEMEVA